MAQKIEIIIDGDNVKAVNALSGVETKLKSLDNKAKGSGGIFDQMFNTFFGNIQRTMVTGLAGAVTGLGVMIKSAIDAGDKLHDMSMKTGIAVETLSLLDYAAKLNSTDIDSVSNLIVKFNRNIYETANGTGKASNEFKKLGISVTDSNGRLKDSETLLFEVTKKFSDMPDGIEKTAMAQKLFSKSGADSIAMLNDLGKNGEEYKKFLKDTGALITTEFATAADRFNDSLTTMKTALSGIGIKLADDLLPSLTATSIALVQIASDSSNTIPLVTLLGDTVKIVATALGALAVGAITAGEIVGLAGAMIAKAFTFASDKEMFETWDRGLAQINATALQSGKIFDAMWNPNKFKDQIDALNAMSKQNELTQLNADKAKRLSDSWKEVGASLRYENMVAGLDPQSKKLDELVHKANQLKEKYYAIPGAIELINFNLSTMISESFKVANLKMDSIIPKEIKPDLKPLNPLDDKAANEAGDRIKNKVQEISLASQLNFEIMQGYGSEAFGAMGDAANAFYELSGNKSKELFVLSKAMAIGQAVMNTYEGASKAIAQGGIFGPIMAGAVIAFGLAQVAKIASTQPGSSGGGGGGGSMSDGSISRPSVMPTSGMVNSNNSTNNTRAVNVTVNVNSEVLAGDSLDKWMRDKLSVSINKAINDGVIDFG